MRAYEAEHEAESLAAAEEAEFNQTIDDARLTCSLIRR